MGCLIAFDAHDGDGDAFAGGQFNNDGFAGKAGKVLADQEDVGLFGFRAEVLPAARDPGLLQEARFFWFMMLTP